MSDTIYGPLRRRRTQQPQVGTFLSLEGRRTHVLLRGHGEPVLLLHGIGGLGEEILSAFGPRKGVFWIAPDRPGYGFSDPLPKDQHDPGSQAIWAAHLLDALKVTSVHLVTHSLACGMALCLASRMPDRILSMTLINPFCRPTPHRWMPGLRLAVAPVVGAVVRPVVPHVLGLARNSVLDHLASPNPVPDSLRRLPLAHAGQPKALLSMSAELHSFNDGMRLADPHVGPDIPVLALLGAQDKTAKPGWHEPWLRSRVARLDVRPQNGVGHMLHHVKPEVAWQTVQDAMAAGRGSKPALAKAGPAALRLVKG